MALAALNRYQFSARWWALAGWYPCSGFLPQPRLGFGFGVGGPRHRKVVFQGLARPPVRVGLPAVVTHGRRRGGNSAPLDTPVGFDRSGPVTEVQRRIGVAIDLLPALR